MNGDTRFTIISLSYVAAALLFVFGLRRLSSPRTARSGNRLAAIGMLIALVATLLDRNILSFWEIGIGTVIGAAIGVYSARRVQMTAMPQMVALFNGAGGATAALVSIAEFLRATGHGESVAVGPAISGALGIAIGAISFTGSLVAFGKLQEILPGRPLLFPGRHIVNALLALGALALGGWIAMHDGAPNAVWALFAVALLLGILVVLPIGGGDMPVMISVLNSLTGVAAALTGIVLANQVLVVPGMLVGASGTLLTLLMSHAMNRPISNVMFGGFGAVSESSAPGSAVVRPVRQTSAEDA
ncbi:MAG TPA: NAD(P)(+) transhydrogenase (Re/Si-specific) subunit beta, partial [Gemmatimonadaceae bacterium]|nr:NAD(P)(+) transhydrogenase (Re/Si-specific) subunit beta [Gemmatimonadaceae bacterium]